MSTGDCICPGEELAFDALTFACGRLHRFTNDLEQSY